MDKLQADTSIEHFPSNYVGSKRKILPWMGDMLIKHGVIPQCTSFIDVFAGSGIVSYYFAKLGLKGWINDLMYSSHFNHLAIFDNGNPAIPDSEFKLPHGVELETYLYKSIEQYKEASIAEDLFADIEDDEKEVSYETIYTSSNPIFDVVYSLMKEYIWLHFTAKEAFEISCVLTNNIINKPYGTPCSHRAVPVICSQGCAIDFVSGDQWLSTEPMFAYIDPPYGGASSNYHKIYSIMECISFLCVQLSSVMHKICEGLAEDDIPITMDIILDCFEYKDTIISDVEKLPHIIKSAWRFNTTDSLKFKTSLERMLRELIKNEIGILVFSFNKDSSWTTEKDFIKFVDEKFGFDTTVERIDYDYAYRTVGTGSKQESMGDMTVGEVSNVVGKKERTSEELLFICKRRV